MRIFARVSLLLLLVFPLAITKAQMNHWNEVPFNEGVCARGAPYSFFYSEGSSDDLLIFFEGGGACWNGLTCQFGGDYSNGGPFFKDRISVSDYEGAHGIFDRGNPANPLSDYDMVLVTYCSADLHSGNADAVYTVPGSSPAQRSYDVRIRHNGANNAQAALAWTYENFPSPSSVALLGCSAGAYGAIRNAYDVMTHYGDVPITHLSDAGVGVLPAGWDGLVKWRLLEELPAEIRGDDLNYDNLTINELYQRTAQSFPENTFAQYTTALDSTQIRFYYLQGGEPTQWTSGMQANLTELSVNLPNFDAYIAGGEEHCILQTPDFYERETAGVRFRDWVAARLAGEMTGGVICDFASGECDTP